MPHNTKLSAYESKRLKAALSQLIDEQDLDGAISLIGAAKDVAETEHGGMRSMMLDAFLSVAHAKRVRS